MTASLSRARAALPRWLATVASVLLAACGGSALPAAREPAPAASTPAAEAAAPAAPAPAAEGPKPAPGAAAGTPEPAPSSAAAPPAILGERGDFQLFTLDGKAKKLADYGARVTVISIWGSFCVPCMKELPYVEALYQAEKGKADVAVLTLVVDDHRDPAKQKAVADVAARLHLTVPVLFDQDIRLYKRLNGEDTPGGKTHAGIVVPQLVIVDPAFSVRRAMGFRVDVPIEQFVREQQALIDLAASGRLPPEDAPRSKGPSPAGAFLGVPGGGSFPGASLEAPLRAAQGDRACAG